MSRLPAGAEDHVRESMVLTGWGLWCRMSLILREGLGEGQKEWADPAVTSSSIRVFVSNGLEFASSIEDLKNQSFFLLFRAFKRKLTKVTSCQKIGPLFTETKQCCDCDNTLPVMSHTYVQQNTHTTVDHDPYLLAFPLPLAFVEHDKHPNRLEQMIMLVLHFEHDKLYNFFSTELARP